MTALTFVKLHPDRAALAKWAASKGIAALKDDLGYAAHAATRAVFGALAPKPFAMRMKAQELELVGYSAHAPDAFTRVASLQTHDDFAAAALGVDSMMVKPMPSDWSAGERFSFECRVVPTRRSRLVSNGRYLEVDVATDKGVDRDSAYWAWLATEFQRFDAARLTGFAPFAFSMTATARRTQARSSEARRTTSGLVPDLVARGEIEVISPKGFASVLARGLGRHRAFGYGCLLLAPQGVLHPVAATSMVTG